MSKLVYIDLEGNYGSAQDMVVFDLEKLEEEDLAKLNQFLDEGHNPFAWVVAMGKRLQREQVMVDQSISITTQETADTVARVYKERYGI